MKKSLLLLLVLGLEAMASEPLPILRNPLTTNQVVIGQNLALEGAVLKNTLVANGFTTNADPPVTLVNTVTNPVPVIGTNAGNLGVDIFNVYTNPIYISFSSDNGGFDAFGRLRVSQIEPLLSIHNQYDLEPLQMEAGATGTGVSPSFDSNTRLVALSATAGSGTSYYQSYQYIPYQPGVSQFIAITSRKGTPVAGAVDDEGYFDANNGIIFRQNGTSGLVIALRSKTSGSVSENAVAQSAWNIDKFDGTGPSKVTMDATKDYILIIDFQYLGMGRVRVGFDVNGDIWYAHQFFCANVLTVPYMQTGTLPVQKVVTATSTATTYTGYFKCCTVQAEGGFVEEIGITTSSTNATVVAASGARTHLTSLRPKTTFNSLANRELFILKSVDMIVTGNNPVYWELMIGATLGGAATYTDVNSTYSAFENENAIQTYTSGGTVIASGYVAGSAQTKGTISQPTALRYPITLDRAGAVRPNGTLSLIVTGLGGTATVFGSLNFTEIR